MTDNSIDWDGHDRRKVADRWKHRRRMAYASLAGALAFPLLILGTDSQNLVGMAGAFYAFTGAVVGAYVGFAALDDKWQAKP
jgi:hypothetical protein